MCILVCVCAFVCLFVLSQWGFWWEYWGTFLVSLCFFFFEVLTEERAEDIRPGLRISLFFWVGATCPLCVLMWKL